MRYKAVLFLLCFVMCFNTDADIRNIRYSIDGGVSSLPNRHIQHAVETNGHPTDFYTCQNSTWKLLTELDGWRKPSATATKIVKGHGWVGVTVKGEVNRTQGGSWETFELTYGGEAIQEIGWLSAAIPIPRRETVSTELYDYIEHAKEDTGTFEFRAGTASTTGASSAGMQAALANLTVSLTPGTHTGGSTSRTMSPKTYTVEFKKSPNDAQEGSPCGLIITIPPDGGGSGSNPPPPPPTDDTPNCPDCTSHCSSPCSCSNSGTCNGTVVDNTPNCPDCTSDCSSPCGCTNSGTCGGTVVAPPPPPPEPEPPTTVACGRSACTESVSSSKQHKSNPCAAGHTYWTCNPTVNVANWLNKHRVRTCRYSECGRSWQQCVTGTTPICNKPYRKQNGLKCWAIGL